MFIFTFRKRDACVRVGPVGIADILNAYHNIGLEIYGNAYLPDYKDDELDIKINDLTSLYKNSSEVSKPMSANELMKNRAEAIKSALSNMIRSKNSDLRIKTFTGNHRSNINVSIRYFTFKK